MSDNPQPRNRVESADEPDPPSLPFFDVSWNYGSLVHVRAGWEADGEVVSLAYNSSVPLTEAGEAINVAYSWTLRRWEEIVGQAAVGEERDADAETGTEAEPEEAAVEAPQ